MKTYFFKSVIEFLDVNQVATYRGLQLMHALLISTRMDSLEQSTPTLTV
jgi:hypothetical protein